ncbi:MULTISPECIES: ferredoxin [unclassified Streptosporangium]|uniref:ferredoxin n=1 Tax=Streptosporangium sp. NPDC005286 TaxID=3154463 RepID=UPI0033B14646
MKITIDQDACIGSGQCVLSSPEVFDQRDADGIVVLLQDSPEPGLQEDVREAVRICPALAITLTPS